MDSISHGSKASTVSTNLAYLYVEHGIMSLHIVNWHFWELVSTPWKSHQTYSSSFIASGLNLRMLGLHLSGFDIHWGSLEWIHRGWFCWRHLSLWKDIPEHVPVCMHRGLFVRKDAAFLVLGCLNVKSSVKLCHSSNLKCLSQVLGLKAQSPSWGPRLRAKELLGGMT